MGIYTGMKGYIKCSRVYKDINYIGMHRMCFSKPRETGVCRGKQRYWTQLYCTGRSGFRPWGFWQVEGLRPGLVVES